MDCETGSSSSVSQQPPTRCLANQTCVSGCDTTQCYILFACVLPRIVLVLDLGHQFLEVFRF